MRLLPVLLLLPWLFTPGHASDQDRAPSCIVVGDSIAVQMKTVLPECTLVGKGGINTWQFNRMYPGELRARRVVFSLATNDHSGVRTSTELKAARARTTAGEVYWIEPMGNHPLSNVALSDIQRWVRDVARQNGDTVIRTSATQPDRIHPNSLGLQELARQVRR